MNQEKSLGLKRGAVNLSKHNKDWQDSFKTEKEKLENILGDVALDIQHVGSTAILTISAKPVIDIAVLVESLEKAQEYVNELEQAGWRFKKDDPLHEKRLFFAKGPEVSRTHYLHIGEKGSGYVEDMIIFRNHLLEHSEVAKEYEDLKQALKRKHGKDRDKYTQKKAEFIKKTLREHKNEPRRTTSRNT